MSNFASIVEATRKIPQTEVEWWRDAYTEEMDRMPLEETLALLATKPPKSLDKLIDGDDRPPWHFALMARAIENTAPSKAKPGSKALWVDGSLHIKGPLKLAGPLVVTGDLTIDGPLVDITEQWHFLVVGRNLAAHAIASSQPILVGGDCKVRDFVWGYEMHCPFVVRGALTTPLLVIGDGRPRKLGSDKGIGKLLDSPTTAELEAHFDKGVIGDAELKPKAMQTRLAAGKPVLK